MVTNCAFAGIDTAARGLTAALSDPKWLGNAAKGLTRAQRLAVGTRDGGRGVATNPPAVQGGWPVLDQPPCSAGGLVGPTPLHCRGVGLV